MTSIVFPGQGSQYLGMGKEVLETNPEYYEYLSKVKELSGIDIQKIIFASSEEELTQTQNAQLAILCISYIKFLYATRKQGIKPDVVAGHSVGEWTALVACGAVSFEQAVSMVYLRGKYMSQSESNNQGSMAAVLGLDSKKVTAELKKYPDVVVANYNSPVQIVISGEKTQLLNALKDLSSAGAKKVVQLKVSGPFHSPFMEQAAQRLAQDIKNIEFYDPEVPIVQNVSAKFETDKRIIKENIIQQITSPVRWTESIQTKLSAGVKKFVEAGPGKVLTGLIRAISKEPELINI
ncbi:MAG TPA: ACP S-malonyltransferase [Petrotogaceae bacterium]|jgi:[acyl-carrier-protein] S-malonyltransferase|nr:ACP S-malonyltransferase [Petrotogaceae bacterium]HOG33895.1 ACP S-malonyltransferase [Petrotogaceae bacterium]